jgi:FixJ family two-component response regulator
MNTHSPWVAIVDDEEAIRRALLRLMRSAGVAARAFASGAEFLAALPAGKPYCVVLDLHMPGMSGFDVLAALATEGAGIWPIVVTGQHSDETRARTMLARPLCYLLKPMNDQLLLDAIGLALRHQRGAQSGAAGDGA